MLTQERGDANLTKVVAVKVVSAAIWLIFERLIQEDFFDGLDVKYEKRR